MSRDDSLAAAVTAKWPEIVSLYVTAVGAFGMRQCPVIKLPAAFAAIPLGFSWLCLVTIKTK